MNEQNNYCAVHGRYPNCYMCKKYSGALNCNVICNGESAFERIETVTVTNATETHCISATHSATMEIEQELCKLNKAIEFFNEQLDLLRVGCFDDFIAMFEFMLPYLESRRDALISQRVIR